MSIQASESNEISHYLGIDYGRSKIGLALADSETKMAFSYGVIDNNEKAISHLAEIIKRENVEKMIIGIPTYINRKEVEYDGEIFAKKIKAAIDVEIEFQNEMFTTKTAQDNLKAKGVRKIKRFDDEEAARIILQDWIERKWNIKHGT
jgi:putative holliday junction resolvase